MSELSRKDITEYCRVLGVHVNDSLKDMKTARNRLAKLYHPDKHSDQSEELQTLFQEKFKKVQKAFEYLDSNYDEIQKIFHHLNEFSLTSKGSHRNRSHWVYKSISKIKDDDK